VQFAQHRTTRRRRHEGHAAETRLHAAGASWRGGCGDGAMTAVVTGARGFIGRNLSLRLAERGEEVIEIGSEASSGELASALSRADFVFHLAGVNRPPSDADYERGNAGFTRTLCEQLAVTGRSIPVVFSSSTQAELDNPY